MPSEQHFINKTDEMIENFIEECEPHVLYYNARGENTEPRLDENEQDFFDNNEEYAYIFDDGIWECYDLHYDKPVKKPIPLEQV